MIFSFGSRITSVLGVILADPVQLQRGAAERDVLLGAVDGLVRDHDVWILDLLQAGLAILVRNEGRAEIFERLAAGDVIEVAVTVDHVFDRRLGHGLDRVDIGLRRAPLADRVGRDHAGRRDDERRLRTAIPEDVDVLGAFDLGGGDLRRLLRLRWSRQRKRCEANAGQAGETNTRHSQVLPGWVCWLT
jgi:hypothetical protein